MPTYFACRWSFLFMVLVVVRAATAGGAAAAEPVVHDPALKLELFAAAPDIVTPIGATFDAKGRLLVIESQTHERDKNYQGPPKDRIRMLDDPGHTGHATRFRTFYEGTEFTMSLARGQEGWIYVATRMKIFRIRDTKGDDVADEEQELLHLETKGNYPHNGLSGLCFDQHGDLYFGIGENLGQAWKLVGKDGSSLHGAGEGGVFRCHPDGSGLTRVAIGLWNPFGICVDPEGRVFAVDNDPDGRPPCRLVQIVPTGDYGFNFKYGRSGKNPLQAWTGELPGTLPMVAGTGEAPCAVLPYHGSLWSTSWGDHRIERFKLVPFGASFKAKLENVVEGDEHFRPVGLAIAPDGSLYFTDWVDKSYPVHGKGRVWRLSWVKPPPADDWPKA
ncbi:MAG TPA: PVC-type heme-binding CxxCH protein, partial [Pirellulales bacterium]|nr:PVC-type heme-binding CxxCH protein [Pirellulales bacterium]